MNEDRNALRQKMLIEMNERLLVQRKELDEELENIRLEKSELVSEKLRIDEKNKLLWEQSAAIHHEKERINQLRIELEARHQEIMDSIQYAKRIQRSFMSSDDYLKTHLTETGCDFFVYFKPKEDVSGDFYWTNALHDSSIIIMCADSTGHGVPGAIMSILNISSLELAIKDGAHNPSEILNYARKEIIERLKNDGSTEGGRDGMDGALIKLNKERNSMNYAASNQPVWLVREGEMLILRADKMPIGKHDKDYIPFNEYQHDLKKGDMIYLHTDGYPDQFGGELGKKYKSAALRDFLVSISCHSCAEQHLMVQQEFERWKGDNEQIDDVCLIGIRV